MTTMKDVFLEIFNKPTNEWPVSFREFFTNLSQELHHSVYSWNVAESDKDYRYWILQSIEHYCKCLEEENLLNDC
jgi:hypothetical protein